MDQPDYEEVMRWFKELSGYRDLIRRRVSVAQKQRRKLEKVRLKGMVPEDLFGEPLKKPPDIDKLGREVEGCG